jgi:hypothetical protein
VRKCAFLVAVLVVTVSNLFPAHCSAQSGPSVSVSDSKAASPANAAQPASNGDAAAAAPVVEATPAAAKSGAAMPSRIGIGVKMSLLGAGVEVATPVTYRTNLRVGFNAFSYSRGFTNDGVNYAGTLNFRSVETHFDWFPFAGGFHLSPGVMVYNGNEIKANAAVTSGQSFTLGGTTYISDAANPISGTGKIGFNKVAPTFLLGWGNLLPRSNKHFSVPFEFGMVFQGAPKATLNLVGNACDSTGANCRNIGSDTTFQNNVIAQQNKLNNDMSAFKVYPVISLGFGYKF